MDVTVLDYNRNYAFAQAGTLIVALWRGRTTAEAVNRGLDLIHARENRTSPLQLITIIESRASLPDAKARASLARFLSITRDELSRSVAVIEAEGFRGVTIRALISGLTLLAPPAFPHHVFAEVPDAAKDLAADPVLSLMGLDASWIVNIVQEVRRYPAKPPHFAWRQRSSQQPQRPHHE